jgi:hypothetical protein
VDLSVGPGGQTIHSYDPGFTPTDVVWTTPIPPESVEINPGAGTASLHVTDVPVFDWTTIENSLSHGKLLGPPVPATISIDMEWNGVTKRNNVRNVAEGFAGEMVVNTATIQFSTQEEGFQFVSSSVSAEELGFAEIGHERNGSFFPH